MKSLKRRLALWLAHLATKPRSGPTRAMPPRDGPRRITVLKLDRIGDFIFATAFLRPLSEQSDTEVTLIVRKPNGSIARQQFPGWKVLELPARETAWRNIFRQGVRAQLTKLEKADLLVDLRAFRDYSDAVIASWISARFKLGIVNSFPESFAEFTYPDELQIYDELIPRETPLPGEPADVAGLRGLVNRVLGGTPAIRPRLLVQESDRTTVRAVLLEKFGISERQPFLLVFPGTSSPIKELPAAQLAEALLAGSELPIIVGGSSADARTTGPLVAELSKHRTVHDAAGLFSLCQNVAFIAEARLIVGMDSCHIHIAGALDVPAVGILGGGQFGDFAPWGESARFRWVHHRTECYGCQWICPFPQPNCLHDIPPAAIAQAIREVLSASA